LELRGKGKEGLEQVEQALSLLPEECDTYFWKGMLSAYSSQGRSRGEEVVTAVEQALSEETWRAHPKRGKWSEYETCLIYEEIS
jgi:hypothetical protein